MAQVMNIWDVYIPIIDPKTEADIPDISLATTGVTEGFSDLCGYTAAELWNYGVDFTKQRWDPAQLVPIVDDFYLQCGHRLTLTHGYLYDGALVDPIDPQTTVYMYAGKNMAIVNDREVPVWQLPDGNIGFRVGTRMKNAPGYITEYCCRGVCVRIKIEVPGIQEYEYEHAILIINRITVWRNGSVYSDTFNLFNGILFKIRSLGAGNFEPTEEPVTPTPPKPPKPGGYEDPDPDPTSDPVPIPSDPVIGVTNAGFINVYSPPRNALFGLGDTLFPSIAGATDLIDAVVKLCEMLANANLIDYVIDCHVIPVTPVLGPNANIKVGYRDTGINVPTVMSDYVNVSCGSISINEFYANFADYVGTTCKLFLPFVGFVDILPEYWQSGTLSVDYKFNIIDGSFMAYVRASSSKSNLSDSVIAQYAGNACMHFPITGANYANMVSGLIGAGTQIASSGGTAAGVMGAANSVINTMASGIGNAQQSNGYNSTAAILGIRTPYLIIERPVVVAPGNYFHDHGAPSCMSLPLGQLSGYAVLDNIDLNGIDLTDAEIEELRSLLTSGVYF